MSNQRIWNDLIQIGMKGMKIFCNLFCFSRPWRFLFGYFWLGSQVEKKYELEPNLEYLIVFLTVGFLLSPGYGLKF